MVVLGDKTITPALIFNEKYLTRLLEVIEISFLECYNEKSLGKDPR